MSNRAGFSGYTSGNGTVTALHFIYLTSGLGLRYCKLESIFIGFFGFLYIRKIILIKVRNYLLFLNIALNCCVLIF